MTPLSLSSAGCYVVACLTMFAACAAMIHGSQTHPRIQASASRTLFKSFLCIRQQRNSQKDVRFWATRLWSGSSDAQEARTIPPLRYLGDERLMQVHPQVSREDLLSNEFQQNLKMLRLAMKKYGGIGIAAPQVGWWTRVFFCYGIEVVNERYPEAPRTPFSVWINPRIIKSSDETNWMWEGCLSVPGMRGWVERPVSVTVTGLDDERGEMRKEDLTGLAARIVQHELDHLDGILFPQRIPGQQFLLPQASMEARDLWAKDWPSPGSHHTTKLGDLCHEK